MTDIELADMLIAAVAIPLTYLTMLWVEYRWPAYEYPPVRRWRWIGIGVYLAAMVFSYLAIMLTPDAWLSEHRLMSLSEHVGIPAQIVVWWLIGTFIEYWFHRARHKFDLLWRVFHQMHHAVPRVDISSAMLIHPLENMLLVVMSSVVKLFLVGMDPWAVVITNYFEFLIGNFLHWNVRTPRWTGLFITRPELHRMHHVRGVHAGNFSPLIVWDRLFGTYIPPRDERFDVGFECGAGPKVQLKVLCFMDANAPAKPREQAAS